MACLFEGEICTALSLVIENDVRVLLPSIFRVSSGIFWPAMLNGLHGLQLNQGIRQDIVTKFVIGREALKAAEAEHILQFLDRDFPRPNSNTSTLKAN